MPKSILVVDDESIVVGITRHKLEDRGYEVRTAENGNEAFLSLKSQIPNLILLDIQMPDMNGYTFIMEKAKIPEYADIPVVVLTAYQDMEPLFNLHGIKAYLLKPHKLQDLIDKVIEIVGQPEFPSHMIQDNVRKIFSDIEEICRKTNRNSKEIALVGVTKTVPVDVVQEAINAGIKHIAENRVQEAVNKFPLLLAKNPHIKGHIIGHLQTNKAKDAIKVSSLVQSVDSLKLAQEIEKQAAKSGKAVEILVQFNTAREKQKFGADPSEASALIENISRLSHVHIKGLMCMAPFTEDQGIIRKTFSDLRVIRDNTKSRFIGHPHVDMGILSMGMSSDYKIAIEEGSTMIRVGSAIFKV